MNPVRVIYSRKRPPACFVKGTDCVLFDVVSAEAISALRRGINDGSINEVVLIGTQVTVGWRVFVDREVEWLSVPPEGASSQVSGDFAQAANRIVQSKGKNAP